MSYTKGKLIKEFTEGWKHFVECIDFKFSYLDAEAIQFMNEMPNKIRECIKQHGELLGECKECVEWFESISRYQNQRLGHGLKEACQNWGEASIVEPFDISKMKQLITQAEKGEE